MSADFEAAYNQAKAAYLAVRHATPEIIRLTGDDRLSFLHRMSTNAIEAQPGWSIPATTLTTPLARTIDRLWLLTRQEDLLILPSPGRSESVEEWLNKHIFFNDDVQLSVSPQEWSLWGVYGPEAEQQVLDLLNLDAAPEPSQVCSVNHSLLFRWKAPDGLRLLLGDQAESKALDRWPQAVSTNSTDVFETLRIEAGYPLYGAEIDEESLPLEAGLRSTIDFHKGCYTGQEIIARMESRGQLARKLVGIRLNEQVEPGPLTTDDGQAAGKLTSCGYSPRFGWIGLGVVRTKFIPPQTNLKLSANGLPVEIVPLPFTFQD